jgi:hypothetical protein
MDAEPVPLATAPRTGFETRVQVDDRGPYFIVEALDGAGDVIGTSPLVRVTATTSPSPSPSR